MPLSIYVVGLLLQLLTLRKTATSLSIGLILAATGLFDGGAISSSVERIPIALSVVALAARGSFGPKQLLAIFGSTLAFAVVSLVNLDTFSAENARSISTSILVVALCVARLDERSTVRVQRLVPILPAVSVILGILWNVLGVRDVFAESYLGFTRLQGSTIAAYLGAICLPAIAVGVAQLLSRPSKEVCGVLGLNVLILLLSGSRMALFASLVAAGPLLFAYVLRRAPLTTLAVGSLGFVATAINLALFTGGSFSRITQLSGNTFLSGRNLLWEVLLSQQGSWIFGNGIGESTKVLREAALYVGTVAPHNEFLRYFFDGGVLGLLAVFLPLLFGRAGSSTNPIRTPVMIYYKIALLAFCFTDNVLTMPSTLVLLLAFPALVGSQVGAGTVGHGGRNSPGPVAIRTPRRA